MRSSSPPAVAVETVRRPRSFTRAAARGVGRGGSAAACSRRWRGTAARRRTVGFGARRESARGARPAPARRRRRALRGAATPAAVAGEPATRLFLGLALRFRFARETRLLPRACGRRRRRARRARALRARLRALASISARRRSSSSRDRASTSARARASRSSSVSARSTTPAPRARRGRERWVSAFGGGGRRRRRRASAQARPARRPASPVRHVPGARRFTFSTTTTLERPWEKLWRTMPCSTVAASGAASSTERRSRFCRRCSRLRSSSVPILGRCDPFASNSAQPFGFALDVGRPVACRGRRCVFAPIGGQSTASRRESRPSVRPRASAACITFVRPNAKSNCSDVNSADDGRSVAPAPRRAACASLRLPSSPPSRASMSARDRAFLQRRRRPCRSPPTTSPALLASDSICRQSASSKSVDVLGQLSARPSTCAFSARANRRCLRAASRDDVGARRHPDAAAGQPRLDVRRERRRPARARSGSSPPARRCWRVTMQVRSGTCGSRRHRPSHQLRYSPSALTSSALRPRPAAPAPRSSRRARAPP